MESYAEERDDIDAVHVHLENGLGERVLTMNFPGASSWLEPHVRQMLFWRWTLRRWLLGPLRLARFDVVHVTPQVPALAVADLRSHWGGRLSTTIDSTVLEAKAQRNGITLQQAERRFRPLHKAERRVFEAADLITSTSTWAISTLHDGHQIPFDRVALIPPFLKELPPSARRPKQAAQAPAPTLRMVFVGNDWRRKGGPRLLRWHQQRWADRAELHVFSADARPSGDFHNFVWHGSVPNEELLQHWLPQMDLFVLPTHSDMSPWAVIEAASAGLPVVTSSIGGLAETVIDGATGYVVQVDDDDGFVRVVERLLADPVLRSQMGGAARTRMETDLNPKQLAGSFFDRLVGLCHH
ncbi:MAG TPA: glycosyltransferase family 4 protein [Acidimicrobiales bacterium]